MTIETSFNHLIVAKIQADRYRSSMSDRAEEIQNKFFFLRNSIALHK
jgi:hypothetical protein